MEKQKDNVVELSPAEFAEKHAKKNFEDNEVYKNEELPRLLKETMLMQGRMIVACLSTKSLEKLGALGELRKMGVTHADARKEVDRILNEMIRASNKG